MRIGRASLVVALAFAEAACGGGVQLADVQSRIPSQEQMSTTGSAVASSDTGVLSFDPTFAAAPELWLGQVGVARSSAGTCAQLNGASFEWLADSVMGTSSPSPGGTMTVEDFLAQLGYPTGPRSGPEVRVRAVVDQRAAANAQALSFFSSELSAQRIAEVVLTQVSTRRIPNTPAFQTAITAFQARNAPIMTDPSVCYVFVVMGYAHLTLLRRYYTQTTAEAGGGYAGVQVGGSYYATSEDYRFDNIFGLSVRVLRRPAGVPAADAQPATAVDAQAIRSILAPAGGGPDATHPVIPRAASPGFRELLVPIDSE